MTKSNIYMVNNNAVSVGENSNIPLGNIVRRYGCDIDGNSNGVNLKTCGYYYISGTITFTAPAAGNAEIAVNDDGNTVLGMDKTITVSTAGTEVVTLPISGVVRVFRNSAPDTITLINKGIAIDMTDLALTAVKL